MHDDTNKAIFAGLKAAGLAVPAAPDLGAVETAYLSTVGHDGLPHSVSVYTEDGRVRHYRPVDDVSL